MCQKTDWCNILEDGSIVHCMRVQSSIESKGKAGGWIHKLRDDEPRKPKYIPKKTEEHAKIDAASIFQKWMKNTTAHQIIQFSESIGVDPSALYMMGCAWAPEHDAWAIPMRDENGKMVGIRLRHTNGDKTAVRGSKAGLFYAMNYEYKSNRFKSTYIVEGPTDCAAGLSMGLYVIGRPSVMGSEDQVNAFLKNNQIYRAVIIADNDEAKIRPDGTKWYPGKEGAVKLQERLKVPSLVILLPSKDIREFYKSGGTKESIENIQSTYVWSHPK